MASRSLSLLVLAGALASMGASYRTAHFVVQAPTQPMAKAFAKAAECHRKELARKWLGKELPARGPSCTVAVKVTLSGAGGATSFVFDNGKVLSQDMRIEGSLERLQGGVLPHEVAHTVLAQYFRCPIPRWADEGSSILSEDQHEHDRHDHMVRRILKTPGRAMPLRRLFTLRDYPSDVMVLYAQGYSVTRFLVEARGRATFLAFVRKGMDEGWDQAVKDHYGFPTVDSLERVWLDWLREDGDRLAQLRAEVRLRGLEIRLAKHQAARHGMESEAPNEWARQRDRLRDAIIVARKAVERARKAKRRPVRNTAAAGPDVPAGRVESLTIMPAPDPISP